MQCNLYEARMKVAHSKTDEQNVKGELSKMDPNLGFSQMLDEDEARPTIQKNLAIVLLDLIWFNLKEAKKPWHIGGVID